MMALRVIREPSDKGVTLGSLYVNDVWQCWTLEDVIREPADAGITPASVRVWKVPGQTAIPSGRYRAQLSHSARFGIVLPELLLVPGFTGIRIHAGNTSADTEGCLLVGQGRGERSVLESRAALQWLLQRLKQGHGDPMFIDVENPPARYLGSAPVDTRSI